MSIGVKLWHDDIRRPPDQSWTWARTNQEAQKILSAGGVYEASLDHDLGLHDADPDVPDADMQAGWDEENDGLKLVKWMIDHKLVPPVVTIHSWNPDGAKDMASYITSAMKVGVIAPVHLTVRRFLREDDLYG
jgi:hypothetical protein